MRAGGKKPSVECCETLRYNTSGKEHNREKRVDTMAKQCLLEGGME